MNPGDLDGPDSNKKPALLIIVMSGKSLVDDRETEIFISKRNKKNKTYKQKKVTVNSKKSYKAANVTYFTIYLLKV